MVDLPMPGSPPTSVAEPGTRPPPSTRSNSPICDKRRGTSRPPSLFNGTNSIRLDLRLTSFSPLGGPFCAASSTRQFQPPQPSHFPAHLGNDEPQDWQTN